MSSDNWVEIENENEIYCDFEGSELPPTKFIYLLHGYSDNRKKIFNAYRTLYKDGYDVLACDAFGHGARYKKESMNLWHDSIEFENNIINERCSDGTKAIIIGESMGGAKAIYLSKNKNVELVFAISPLFDAEIFESPTISQNLILEFNETLNPNRKILEKEREQIYKILPANNSFTKKEKEKIFIAYSKNDRLFPQRKFHELIEYLTIPESRIKVVRFSNHGNIINNHSIKQWVRKNINKSVKTKEKTYSITLR